MTVNRLRERLAGGTPAVGAWCSSGSPLLAELLSAEGFDYVCVDCQHGLVGPDGLVAALLGIRHATPVVRVASNDAGWIGRALDAGAEAVIVPLVDSPEAAARAAAACRYAPEGVRSFGPTRSRLFLNEAPPAEVNRQVQCLVMIETANGVARAAEICATPGVDGVYVGPADLAVSLGLVPGMADERLEAAIEQIREACAEAGVVAGVHATNGSEARRRLEQGFAMVTAGTDTGLLRAAAAAELGTARGG